MNDAWVQTYTGKRFVLASPDAAAVCIDDIAHSLSLQCRFNGHTREFYSVAQHSLLVASLLPGRAALYGLLHDASEAYTGDIVTPVKSTLRCGWRPFARTEAKLRRFLYETLIRWPDDGPALTQICKEVDCAGARLLVTEARDLLSPSPAPWLPDARPLAERIVPLAPDEAERCFLLRYEALLASRVWYG